MIQDDAVDYPIPASAADPDYYLRNFLLVLETVRARDGHLFTAEERTCFERLEQLPDGARRLYVRLSERKGPLFRVAALVYAEIPDLPAAAEALVAADLAAWGDPTDTLPEVLDLATVPELLAVCRALGAPLKRSARRDEVVATLTGAAEADRPAFEAALAGWGPRIRLRHKEIFDRVAFLFFLSEWQGRKTLLQVDLAHVRFTSYPLRRSRPVFPTRADLDAYEAARAEASQLWALAEAGELTAVLDHTEAILAACEGDAAAAGQLHPFLGRFHAGWVRARTLDPLISALERAHAREVAVACLRRLLATPWVPRRRGRFWDRLSTNLTHLGQGAEALEACASGLADPHTDEATRRALRRRHQRLCRALGLPAPALPPEVEAPEVTLTVPVLASGPYRRTVFQGLDGAPCAVEALALQHYAAQGWSGIWGENVIHTTLFGLLLWDIVFAPVPDVFQTPYQDAPLDLRTEAFYPTRQPLIEARLEALRRGDAPRLLEAAWSHCGEACRGVYWQGWTREELGQICQALGGPALALLMGALARDWGGLSRGLPDLLLWRGVDEARLVEVKGPRDRLSEEQHAWLRRLMEGGIAVEVLRVDAA